MDIAEWFSETRNTLSTLLSGKSAPGNSLDSPTPVERAVSNGEKRISAEWMVGSISLGHVRRMGPVSELEDLYSQPSDGGIDDFPEN